MTSSMVFPTQVGVFPYDEFMARIKARLPHAGGGVSAQQACNP